MGMTPEQFFGSFVEGNFLDCYESPGDVRRAFNAAVSASHLADHYFKYNLNKKPSLVAGFASLGHFVEHLSTATGGAFKDIRSISNAYKHLYTDATSKFAAHSTVNSSGAIESLELSEDEDLVAVAEEHSESEAGSYQVVFTRKDGSHSQFLPTLVLVIDHWRTVLQEGA